MFQELRQNEEFFQTYKAEKIHHQQTCTTRKEPGSVATQKH